MLPRPQLTVVIGFRAKKLTGLVENACNISSNKFIEKLDSNIYQNNINYVL